MADEPRHKPRPHEDNEPLERDLVRVRSEEEKLERELENVRREEVKIERELESKHHFHTNHRFSLVFIINGEDFKVEAQGEEALRVAVEKALAMSGNTGRRDPAEWEVRDSGGVLLEMAREISALGLADGTRLFLSLKVGAGGNDGTRS